jgi:hypothetical protein
MKKLILLMLMTNMWFSLKSQPTDYDQRMIYHGVYLEKNGVNLNYCIDKQKPISTYSLSKKTLYASVRGENVNILLNYINPLKMSYDLSYSSVINPDLQNVLKFFNDKLIPSINTLSLSPTQIPQITLPVMPEANNGGIKAQADANFKIQFKTQELYQLGLLIMYNPKNYITTVPGKAVIIDQNFKSDLLSFLKELNTNELDLSQIKNGIKEALTSLINADDYEKGKEAVTNLNKKIEGINKAIKTEESKSTAIKDLYAKFDEVKVYNESRKLVKTKMSVEDQIDSLKAIYVKGYREYLLKEYTQKVDEQIEIVKEIVDNITVIGAKFTAGFNQYKESDRSTKIAEISVDESQIEDVIITVHSYDIKLSDDLILTVTEKDKATGRISLRKHSWISTDLGAAVVYPFNFQYPTYLAENDATGTLIVKNKGRQKISVVASTMLNLVLKTDTYPVYPLLQLGVGLGNDGTATFSAGAGIKVPKSIALSCGVLSGFYKNLQTLSVGDAVKDQVTFNGDFKLDPIHPAFYIAVQYSF